MAIVTASPTVLADLPADVYHSALVTPTPCLSSSLALLMIERCPAIVWRNHPALNPDFEPENKAEFDLGTAVHTSVLEPARFRHSMVIVRGKTKDGKPSAGYASQDAKDQRNAAYLAGKTPLLPEQAETVEAMSAALFRQLRADSSTAWLLQDDGVAEASHFWADRNRDVWCKSRPDWRQGDVIANYKTTSRAVGPPRDFGRVIAGMGYVQRAAWEIEAIRRTTERPAARYLIIAQEIEPPYLAKVYELQRSDLDYGALRNRWALDEFARCLEAGTTAEHWPGYRDPDTGRAGGITPLPLPGWLQMQWEEDRAARADAGKYATKPLPKAADLRAAMYAQRPLDDEGERPAP